MKGSVTVHVKDKVGGVEGGRKCVGDGGAEWYHQGDTVESGNVQVKEELLECCCRVRLVEGSVNVQVNEEVPEWCHLKGNVVEESCIRTCRGRKPRSRDDWPLCFRDSQQYTGCIVYKKVRWECQVSRVLCGLMEGCEGLLRLCKAAHGIVSVLCATKILNSSIELCRVMKMNIVIGCIDAYMTERTAITQKGCKTGRLEYRNLERCRLRA